jgi:hypothetical protein
MMAVKAVLQYSPDPTHESQKFRFRLDELIACIDHRIELRNQRKRTSRRHPQETRSYLATLRLRLVRAKRSDSTTVDWSQLTDATPRQLPFFIMYLLEIGGGVVICSECQQEYPASQLTAQHWWSLSFGGDALLCPERHIVYSTTSKIGSAMDGEDVISYSPVEDE